MEFNATFLVSAISFIVFVFLMNKIFYAPLEQIIGEREKLVGDTLNEAYSLKEEANRLLQDREAKLNKATEDHKKIINDGVKKANSKADLLLSEAKSNAVESLKELKAELDNKTLEAKQELNEHIKGLAEQITTKILG